MLPEYPPARLSARIESVVQQNVIVMLVTIAFTFVTRAFGLFQTSNFGALGAGNRFYVR